MIRQMLERGAGSLAADRPPSSLIDTTELLSRIAGALRAFSPPLVEKGRGCLAHVEDFEWCPRRREFTLPVGAPGSSPQRVTIGVKLRERFELLRSCTCSGGSADCPHQYAGLYHIYSVLSAREGEVSLEIAPREEGDVAGDWLGRLERLDRLLEASPSPPAGGEGELRLAWRIKLRLEPELEIEALPCEQRRLGAGEWTRGRRITWQRLASSPELWTTSADRAVAGLLRPAGAALDPLLALGPFSTVDGFDLLERLIDHPHVTWAEPPHGPVRVLRGSLALSLRAGEDGSLRLLPAVNGDELGARGPFRLFKRGLVAVDPSTAEIVVAAESGSRLSLIEHVLEERLAFPYEARGLVMARLPAMEAILPVELPGELAGRSVPADERVHVLLSPLDAAGLEVSLRMRPLPGAPCWPPGEGPASCKRLMDECWVTARRDLERERRIASRLAARLGLEGPPSGSGWTWRRQGEEALDLLALLGTEESGDVVIEWPEGKTLELLPQRIGPGALRVHLSDREDLFGLAGFVEVEGSRVALATLIERVRQGLKYVPVSAGRWAEISERLRERLEVLAEVAHGGQRGLEVGRAALPAVVEALDDAGAVECCEAWQELRRRFERSLRPLDAVPRLRGVELRRYQLDGYLWMRRLAHWGVGACLADDMGLGKTVQALAVMLDRAAAGPILVVAPTSVSFNWIRETRRFAPELRALHYRDTDRSLAGQRFAAGDVVVISYGLLRRDVELLRRIAWGTLVLDEAQHLKNSRSQTARAIRLLSAAWRLALTGTPLENHLGELWSLFHIISPGLFGSWAEFRERYAEPIEKGNDALRREALRRRWRAFILRRTKEEVLHELPPRTDVRLTAVLSPPERRLYEEARLAALASLMNGSRPPSDLRFEALSALTRLRQLACHPRLVHPELALSSAKMEVFIETMDGLRQGGHRALVFSQFTRHLGLIREELDRRGIGYCYLDGQTPPSERARQVDRFQAGEGQAFLISLKAGGTGLNLTAADYVIHMDPWWNPAVEDQATDRAHRLGQTRPVTVYRIVAENTIEEEIQKLQAAKRQLIEGVLEGSDGAGRLSTGELIEVIRAGFEEGSAPISDL
jgi:superfamily II DNA or RNA helicase